MHHRFALVAFFGIVAFLLACGAVKKTQECNALFASTSLSPQIHIGRRSREGDLVERAVGG